MELMLVQKVRQDEVTLWESDRLTSGAAEKKSFAGSLYARLLKKAARGCGIWKVISRWYFLRIFPCYVFQMGFIQLNEDFIFIEPFNDTMAILGHPHRLYRQKRSAEGKVEEKSALHNHHCGVVAGNFSWKDLMCTVKWVLWSILSLPLHISISWWTLPPSTLDLWFLCYSQLLNGT